MPLEYLGHLRQGTLTNKRQGTGTKEEAWMRGSVSNQPTGRKAEEPSAFKYEREESNISHVYLVCLSTHLYLYFKEEPVFNTSLYPPEVLLLVEYQSLQFQMSILTKVLIYLIKYHLSNHKHMLSYQTWESLSLLH